MTKAERLVLVKANLQMTTTANDVLLNHLLDQADALIQREGITDNGTTEYDSCVIDYTAYLFRKRAASTSNANGETGMPRFLRWELNNLLFSQKIAEGAQ